MKKIIIMTISIFMSALLLTGCGAKNEPVEQCAISISTIEEPKKQALKTLRDNVSENLIDSEKDFSMGFNLMISLEKENWVSEIEMSTKFLDVYVLYDNDTKVQKMKNSKCTTDGEPSSVWLYDEYKDSAELIFVNRDIPTWSNYGR